MYNHYNVSLERCNEARTLTFRFTCRFDPLRHPSQTRGRLETSQGTSNLERSRKKCQQLRGEDMSSSTRTLPPPTYSRSKHHALIAARCASSKRPFNSVSDPYYIQEVQMLRPETILPSPQTVSRDVLTMYLSGARAVHDYFSVCNFSFSDVPIPTDYAEAQWCHPSCNGWVDVAHLGMLSWNCGHLVLPWQDSPVHSGIRQV